MTKFSVVYDAFFEKVTDDMFYELTELDTFRMLQDLLLSAIPKFEFPKVNLTEYEYGDVIEETVYCGVESDYKEVTAVLYDSGYFYSDLSYEEVNILAVYMAVEWLGLQLATIENTRQKYTGSDFQMSSQANHMEKLLKIKMDYEREGFHLQRLYGRRRIDKKGRTRSSFDIIMKDPKGGHKW